MKKEERIDNRETEIHVFYAKKMGEKYLPQMENVKIPHMMHGEFVMVHPGESAEKTFAFLLPEEQEI